MLILATLGLPLLLAAQTNVLDQFRKKYADQENVTHLSLNGSLLHFASKQSTDENTDKLFNALTGLELIAFEKDVAAPAKDLPQILNSLKDQAYEDLVYFRNQEGNNVRIMVREKNTIITDVFLLINGEKQFLLLNLQGKMKYTDLNDLHLDIKGAEELKKLPEDRKKLKRA
jgi:hypothetical protein